MFRRTTFLL